MSLKELISKISSFLSLYLFIKDFFKNSTSPFNSSKFLYKTPPVNFSPISVKSSNLSLVSVSLNNWLLTYPRTFIKVSLKQLISYIFNSLHILNCLSLFSLLTILL